MLKSFLTVLRSRNKALYYFGWLCFLSVIFCVVMINVSSTQVLGINAWYKPLKFFFSVGIFSWTMGWFLEYLNEKRASSYYTCVVIIVLAFEVIYIAIQASSGQLSHFNNADLFHGIMFSLMGFAITLMTAWTGYIGYLFFKKDLPELPAYYLLAIRLGILFFVVFAFEGAIIASNEAHTVGAPDGSAGLFFTNWSTKYGDLRISHFLGMHALQIIPLTSFYFLKSVRSVTIFASVYFIIVVLLLLQALAGKPLISF